VCVYSNTIVALSLTHTHTHSLSLSEYSDKTFSFLSFFFIGEKRREEKRRERGETRRDETRRDETRRDENRRVLLCITFMSSKPQLHQQQRKKRRSVNADEEDHEKGSKDTDDNQQQQHSSDDRPDNNDNKRRVVTERLLSSFWFGCVEAVLTLLEYIFAFVVSYRILTALFVASFHSTSSLQSSMTTTTLSTNETSRGSDTTLAGIERDVMEASHGLNLVLSHFVTLLWMYHRNRSVSHGIDFLPSR